MSNSYFINYLVNNKISIDSIVIDIKDEYLSLKYVLSRITEYELVKVYNRNCDPILIKLLSIKRLARKMYRTVN